MQPLRAEVRHLVAAGRLIDVGHLLQQHVASLGRAQREVADVRDAVAACRVEQGDNVEDRATLVGLADDITLVGGADQVEHVHGV